MAESPKIASARIECVYAVCAYYVYISTKPQQRKRVAAESGGHKGRVAERKREATGFARRRESLSLTLSAALPSVFAAAATAVVEKKERESELCSV